MFRIKKDKPLKDLQDYGFYYNDNIGQYVYNVINEPLTINVWNRKLNISDYNCLTNNILSAIIYKLTKLGYLEYIEEKKEYIEHEILDRLYCLEENDFDKNKVDDGYIKAVLNACKETKSLIEKQSKEIEELKKPKYVINCKTNEITKLTNDFVSKDKIKAKIEELKEDIKYSANPLSIDNSKFGIKVLQSLLEKE